MPSPTAARAAHRPPSLWITRIARVLAGDRTCLWGAYHEVHRTFPRHGDDGDLAGWMVRHTGLVHASRAALQGEGFSPIWIEDENLLHVRNAGGTVEVGGRPDLRAARPANQTLLIADAKTGARRAADLIQVKIGMLLAPVVWGTAFPDWMVTGRVIYPNGQIDIPAAAIDDEFRAAFRHTVALLAGPDELPRSPSARECRFCPIGPAHCPERVEAPALPVAASAGVF